MRVPSVLWSGLPVAVLLAGVLPAQADSVRSAEFNIYLQDGRGNVQTVQSTVVPLVPKFACYGWRIRLDGKDRLVQATEVFTLPAAPKTWGNEGDQFSATDVAKDRLTSTTTLFYPLKNGWFGHQWCVAAGDPTGPYTIKVYLAAHLLKQFDFVVQRVSTH